MKIKIITNGLSKEEEAKVEEARIIIERCFNSADFKSFILNYSFEKTWKEGPFWRRRVVKEKVNHFHDTDLINEQVFKKIMNGKEILSTEEEDQEADIFLEIDRRRSRNVVGYTNPKTPWQYIYKYFFDAYNAGEVAGNLSHEYCHKLGFDHAFRASAYRDNSVPYAVGNFVEKFSLY